MKLAVVGGGLAGLAAAVQLQQRHDVTVFESELQTGGKIRSERFGGLLFEWGPNAFASTAPELRNLIGRCGLENDIVPADAAAVQRYIYFNGRLHALPSKPHEALAFSLLTFAGKARALRGLAMRVPQTDGEESVYEFFARRFGPQVAERVVAPALLGISAGDARNTSVGALFPRLGALERQHGSLFAGLARERRAPGRLCTLRGGMTRLIDGLNGVLGTRINRSCEVRRLERTARGWRLTHDRGEDDADAVVLATPAYAAAGLLRHTDATLATLLERIPYAPMRVCGIAFRAQDVPMPLDGFGFLAARHQGLRILGALYTSTIFPDQAPARTAYLRVFLGGTSDPQIGSLSERETVAVIRTDLERTLGITAPPVTYHEHMWKQAIPQYALGHLALLRDVNVRLASLPGIALTGNAYRGIGVADVVRDAAAQVDRLTLRDNE